jgi:hypothetical protein
MVGVKIGLGAAVVVAAVGALATAMSRDWDLCVVFVALLVIQAALTVALLGSRRLVTLRIDLARWAEERSALTGEPVAPIIDRAVAAYRDGLTGPDD